MNDLEQLISSALKDRAHEVTPDRLRFASHAPAEQHNRKMWIPTIVSAVAVLLLTVAITIATGHKGEASIQANGSPARGIAGYQWDLTTIVHNGDVYHYTVGGHAAVFLIFRPHGGIEGSDGVNYYNVVMSIQSRTHDENGHYELTKTGYRVTGSVAETTDFPGGGLKGNIAANAIEAALTGRDIEAREVNATLTIEANGYRLTLIRGVPVGDAPASSPTRTR